MNSKRALREIVQSVSSVGRQPKGHFYHGLLGGLYALERIARNSARDHWAIVEVLSAYIRRNALSPLNEDEQMQVSASPGADIQAVLTVLGRRRRDGKREDESMVVDLRNAYVRRANLRDADLAGAYLSNADLEGANLVQANLTRANLSNADLAGAYLIGANLEGANLVQANLAGANLSNANLEKAGLAGANLAGAGLMGADLDWADGLRIDQVKSARDWKHARYDKNFRAQLGLR